jgi:hypothetical protein
LAESNGIQPKAIEEKPAVTEFAAGYINAFNSLSRSRGIGMNGPLPITISEVWALLSIVGVGNGNGEKFLRIVQTLDGMWLEDYSNRNKK